MIGSSYDIMSRRDHQHHHHQFDDDDGGDHQNDGGGDDHQEVCDGGSGCGIINSVQGDADNVRCPDGAGADDEAVVADEDDLMNAFILFYNISYNIFR